MKVLVLGWEYPPVVAGGLGAACHGLTTALADRGHQILLATPHVPGAALPAPYPGVTRVSLGGDGGESEATPLPTLNPYAVDSAGDLAGDATVPARSPRGRAGAGLYGGDLTRAIRLYTRSVIEALATQEFDVVHAHDWMTIPAALHLRFARQRPVCLHVHSTAFDRSGAARVDRRGSIAAVEHAGVRTADRVIAVSEYTRDVLVREYHADLARVRVVHNAGSAAPSGEPSPIRADGPPTVLFVGRLTRQKGIGFLLRAAARVLQKQPDVRFVLVGDGEERAAMIELSASLGIARRVFFAGSVDDAARDRAYRNADVFVLSSISEPFGLTPLEALQHGAAVVLTNACGVREVLPSAPVVPPWDARGLSEQILRLLGDEALRDDLVARGRRELQGLTWASSAEALEGVLAEAIESAEATRSISRGWAAG